MFDFCPHCGQTLGGQEQSVGQKVLCRYCGKEIGVVEKPPEKVLVDRAAEILQSGTAARCPVCDQLVALKVLGVVRSLVPHFSPGEKRKMCPGGGKPVNIPAAAVSEQAPSPALAEKKPGRKDLAAFMNREQIQVAACRRGQMPTIEVLTLEYLDKADRVRLQIEALRDLLGKAFQVRPYPAALHRPHLNVWSNAEACVVAKKHERGGYEPMDQAELSQVVEEVRQHPTLFYP